MERTAEVGTDLSLVEALTVAQRRLARALGAVLAEEGYTVDQWRILRALADGTGHPMGELAEALQMPHPTLTRLMDGLVDTSLVYRRQTATDRRRVTVHLSRQGQTRLRRLDALVTAHESALRQTAQWTELSRLLHGVLDG